MIFIIIDIFSCNRCDLYKNQKPLLDKEICSDVMWVGLSAKKVEDIFNEIPLNKSTNSGTIIHNIEKDLLFDFYKTNLVKCLPLSNNKLRYPTTTEMKCCLHNLNIEIEYLKPKIIFLLGNKVSNCVLKFHNISFKNFDNDYNYSYYLIDNILYIPIHHPSYIYVYRRKDVYKYIESIKNIINNNIK